MKKTPSTIPGLTAEAADWFERLRADYGITDAAGLLLLQSAAEAFDRLQEARRALAKDGAIVTDRFGQPKPHPAAGIERDARNQMHGALRLLRLAPEPEGAAE
jgi:phage terminase small subunit